MGQAKQRKLSDPNYGKVHVGQSLKRSDNLGAKKPVVVRASEKDRFMTVSIVVATVAAEKLHELDPSKDIVEWTEWLVKEATELLKAEEEALGEMTRWISNL